MEDHDPGKTEPVVGWPQGGQQEMDSEDTLAFSQRDTDPSAGGPVHLREPQNGLEVSRERVISGSP